MNLLTIDKEKCKQDGLCAADCPTAIIRFPGQGHYPELVSNAEAMCLRCGHCVAVCPHGALDHAQVHRSLCPPIDKDKALSEDQAEQFLRSRRSVRRFKDQPVAQATLQRLIEIARYAPTSSNMQTYSIIIVRSPVTRQKLAVQIGRAHV